MDEEARAAYLKEKADKEAHEKAKDKMLKNQMKRYSTIQGGGAGGKKKGKKKKGRGKKKKGRGKKK